MIDNIYTEQVYNASVEWFQGKTDLDSLHKSLELLNDGEVPEYLTLKDYLDQFDLQNSYNNNCMEATHASIQLF